VLEEIIPEKLKRTLENGKIILLVIQVYWNQGARLQARCARVRFL